MPSPSPVPPVAPYPAPTGRTARRLEWAHLPPAVRALIEERIGTPVAEARSQTSGFTPGFASVLVGADGSHHFVKAASVKAQRMFAESYREEARKLAALPASTLAPRLLWTHDDADWVVLGHRARGGPTAAAALAAGRPRRRARHAGRARAGAHPAAARPRARHVRRGPGRDTRLLGPRARHPRPASRRRGGRARRPLRLGDRRQHPRPHRRPRRQPAPGRRRPRAPVRLELAGGRRALDRLAVPARRPARRRPRRGDGCSTPTRPSPASTPRPSTSCSPCSSATSSSPPTTRCRRPRLTSATISAGRVRWSGTGSASAGAGPWRRNSGIRVAV